MSRFLCLVMVVVAGLAVIAAPASAAPDEDFVVGTGQFVVRPFGLPPAVISVFIDAHSDPLGGNPSGTVNLFFDAPIFHGPVTCLVVTGNTAIIGFEDEDGMVGDLAAQVVDNSATGSPDTVTVVSAVDGCSIGTGIPVFPLVSGDFVVHDAVPLTSKDQCKDGGWRDFSDDEGHPFKNQGQCVAFVEHAA
jgi:hypothetical protein